MTEPQARKLRTILNALFSFEKDGRYGVAIQNSFEYDPTYWWEVHVFVRVEGKSGHLNLALLAQAIALVATDLLAVESHYDLGTIKGEHLVQSWKIW